MTRSVLPATPAGSAGPVGPLAALRTWGEMVKFSHSIFALPFALIATVLAGRELPGRSLPYAGQFALIILCMVAARSAAMTFNRIADAAIDARNPRTSMRALPAGRLSRRAAWWMLGAAAAAFVAGCSGFWMVYGNPWPLRLAGPVLAVLCAYSYAKRVTRWTHLVLGAAIGMAPAAAWIAIHPASLGAPAALLTAAVACWIGGFDILYACQDIDIDRRDGLHSLPARMGPAPALWIARALHAACLAALAGVAFTADLGWIYLAGVAAAAILLAVENALVRPGDYRRVNLAFFTVNGIVSLVLAAATIADVLT